MSIEDIMIFKDKKYILHVAILNTYVLKNENV